MNRKESGDATVGEIGWEHRALAEKLRDIVFTMDLDGRVTYVSPAVTNQTGFLPEEYINQPVTLFLTPESAAIVTRIIRENLALPPEQRIDSVLLELQQKTKTGSVIDIETHGSWICDAAGNAIGIIGVTRDISERKRIEQKLRESEERFRAFSSYASEGIVIHENGIIIDANEAAAAMAGYANPEALIGRHGLEDVPFTPESRHALAPFLRGPAPETQEAELVRQDGVSLRVLIRGRDTLFRGRPVRIVSLLDITSHYETEQALRDSEAKFRTIGISAPDALILINSEGLVEYWNPAAERMFGYTALEMQGTDVHARVMPETFRPRYEAAFRKFSETGTGEAIGLTVELTAKRKNGSEFPIEISVSPIFVQGKYWSSAIIRDITDRKRAEADRKNLQEQLAQASKMEAVGRLAGGIAHDFNNLLTTILGYSEMILTMIPEGDPLRAEIQEISRAGKRAAGLTQQLLAFSRKQVIMPRTMDLNEAVKEARKMLDRLIGEHIRLVLKLAPDLGRIKADPHQIDQVLLNLAVNSRDAMPNGGTLTIATANITIGKGPESYPAEIASGNYVVLSVADTGIGMNEETRNRIFEPFFSTKEIGKGTGLGLAMVYGIAKQNGGTVAVESAPGKGTTFRIFLPLISDVPGDIAVPPKMASPMGTETVLLVEDDEMVQRLTRMLLLHLGYDVLQARDTDDAIRIADTHSSQIQLLLTDVIMPGMNGVELYSRLRAKFPGLKVLFMSGYAEDVIARQGVLPDGTQFIQKPFNMDNLASRVRQALDAS
jgi:PAS domain S-box-containing protein